MGTPPRKASPSAEALGSSYGRAQLPTSPHEAWAAQGAPPTTQTPQVKHLLRAAEHPEQMFQRVGNDSSGLVVSLFNLAPSGLHSNS